MPPQTLDGVVELTESHLDYLESTNDRLHQYKGRTQAVMSMLDVLQQDTVETEAEPDMDALEQTRESVETFQDNLEHWIERTTDIREVVQTTKTTVQAVKGMAGSLTDIDEDFPEQLASLSESFEDFRDTTESVYDDIETAVELLERLVTLLIDTPESDKIAEASATLTDYHQSIKEKLDIE